MTSDEAKELWPEVLAKLPDAWRDVLAVVQDSPVGLVQMVKARYESGCEEYAGLPGHWTTQDEKWCTDNALEELADLWVYLAFRRVLRSRARSSVSPAHQSSEIPE